ncbi:MAG: protein-L-isoaspartate(D-aspartate) O-methyltransferase [Desulfobacterales bacterium]|jgi:protein-L-isoaspartate(D-aspartate) O-methyltransferase|nr:protein-L-isoaspartate(D-aspartate) O-methyltransferase [Desulfobacteraceae bacterium]MBT4363233.1 protein-L-isoaspartate(D-aspartate) O-methyltransferase [Desulfobacteraceae bacterium]MBT7084821.1 protein-L-isoaspartate(D-aspartate) O-methyltransferase [Desulfobacterales bacterium]MBT7697145.1 protein-L-isoaspartate(D-aspartate) O-methyltransferase [Desulfobacterales bacterium]
MIREEKKFTFRREEMVKKQLEARGINDNRVLEAFRKVPRHLFVNEAFIDKAYIDSPLPIGNNQTISQPYIVAEMTQELELTGEDKVLEIGTGSGYQAAILAEIVEKVYTIERIHPLYIKTRSLFDKLKYHNILTRYSDGTSGYRDEGPFDAIIITAGSPKIPEPLINQLAIGGRLIIPVGSKDTQELIKVYKDESGIHKTNLGKCRFVQLIGEHAWKSPKKT